MIGTDVVIELPYNSEGDVDKIHAHKTSEGEKTYYYDVVVNLYSTGKVYRAGKLQLPRRVAHNAKVKHIVTMLPMLPDDDEKFCYMTIFHTVDAALRSLFAHFISLDSSAREKLSLM